MKKFFLIFCTLFFGCLLVYAQGTMDTSNAEFNECSHLSFGAITGDTIFTSFCANYLLKTYSFQTTYCHGQPCALMIYSENNPKRPLVAEFLIENNDYNRSDYHCKTIYNKISVCYRKKLLKVYLKKKGVVQYKQISYLAGF